MSGPPPAKTSGSIKITKGPQQSGQRVVIYGEGGIGKTSLAALAPKPLVLDCEGGSAALDVARADVDSWQTLINAMGDTSALKPFETIVIDTATAAEELATEHVCRVANKTSIEDFGYGKGYKHLFEEVVKLLQAADRLVRAGKNVVIICHDTTQMVRNPSGEDFPQYQPAMLNTGSTGRIRDRVKGWCDHLLFVQYDRSVTKEGKAEGSGTRTVYTQAGATFWAKSRTMRDDVPFVEGDDRLWRDMGIKESA